MAEQSYSLRFDKAFAPFVNCSSSSFLMTSVVSFIAPKIFHRTLLSKTLSLVLFCFYSFKCVLVKFHSWSCFVFSGHHHVFVLSSLMFRSIRFGKIIDVFVDYSDVVRVFEYLRCSI